MLCYDMYVMYGRTRDVAHRTYRVALDLGVCVCLFILVCVFSLCVCVFA